MDNLISVLLVGIGGYGQYYVRELLGNSERDDYQLSGVVDPYADVSPVIKGIREREIPVYKSLEGFFQDNNADYVCIASPIQFHARQTITALENGAAVLCEKPLTPTVQEGREMLKAREGAGRPVGIGYQWSFSSAIQTLKKDIIKGIFGKPLRLKTVVIWPRDYAYYNRNSWAGRIKDSSGKWIMDSVASNATAHYLHNMFYVLGRKIEESARPLSLEAELYRANKIWIMLDAIKEQKSAPCGVKAALSHVMAVNGIQEATEISDFPETLIRPLKDEQGNERAVYVEGLSETLLKAYNEWKLPYELG